MFTWDKNTMIDAAKVAGALTVFFTVAVGASSFLNDLKEEAHQKANTNKKDLRSAQEEFEALAYELCVALEDEEKQKKQGYMKPLLQQSSCVVPRILLKKAPLLI